MAKKIGNPENYLKLLSCRGVIDVQILWFHIWYNFYQYYDYIDIRYV